MPNQDILVINQVIGHLLTAVDEQCFERTENIIKPEYIGYPFLADLVDIELQLNREGKNVDPTTLYSEFMAGNQQTYMDRLRHAHSFFEEYESMSIHASDEDILARVSSYIATCTVGIPAGAFLESLLCKIRQSYISRERRKTATEYLNYIERNPSDYEATEKFRTDIQKFHDLATGIPWKKLRIDLSALKLQPEIPPLILRKDIGIIYPQDVHMVTGNSGVCKSLFVFYMAASALNDGLDADRTLGMYAGKAGLRVGYIDTELNTDTIKRRLAAWENAGGDTIYDSERLVYISIRRFTKEERRQLVFNFIRNSGCDIIIVDGLRDLCDDFNDAREAGNLADSFKRVAEVMNVAIIVTSHTTKGTDYSRGHLGSQFHNEVALAMLLKTDKDNKDIVEVIFDKTRNNSSKNFRFFKDQSKQRLCLLSDILENPDLSKSQKNALDVFHKHLITNREYTRSEIEKILIDSDVNPNTVKKYLQQAKGVTLLINPQSGKYYLPPEKPEIDTAIGDDDDLPD